MASNKDNQSVVKNEDTLEVENISNDHSIKSEKKLDVFSQDENSNKEEEADNGFACFGSVSYTHLTLPTTD